VEVVVVIVAGVAGVVVGAVVGVLAGRLRAASELADAQALTSSARQDAVAAVAERDAAVAAATAAGERERQAQASAEAQLEVLRKDLAAIVADETNQARRTLAEEVAKAEELRKQRSEAEITARTQAISGMVDPVRDHLRQLAEHLKASEEARQHEAGKLGERLDSVGSLMQGLNSETAKLTTALRGNSSRGRWGEYQLRRVVEMAGMTEHVAFTEQQHATVDGNTLRPDLLVHLPDERVVVVDAKAPMPALDVEPTDDAQAAARAASAKALRAHVKALASKDYARGVNNALDRVVMFLPAESVFSEALQADPDLLEHAITSGVVIATPTTLLALLTAVEVTWEQERTAENAKEIAEQGKKLLGAVATWADHLARVGTSLTRAVDAYNKSVGSLESRVLPSVRHMQQLGVRIDKDMPDVATITEVTRTLSAPELTAPGPDGNGELGDGGDTPDGHTSQPPALPAS